MNRQVHKHLFPIALGSLALLAGCATSHQGSPGVLASRAADDDNEVAMTLDQVPDAVRATILEHADAGAITEIVLDSEGGTPVYDIETGHAEFSVSPAGDYLGAEADDGDDDEDDDD